jgi:hypothetical protein
MINPVTSTKVATNGAEEVAGSSFNFLRIKGTIEPESVPQSTIITRETPTLNPTKAQ